MYGDITKINEEDIQNLMFYLSFPCKHSVLPGWKGFLDTRGTLFDIESTKVHSPKAFILENVEGLVKHDLQAEMIKLEKPYKLFI